MRISIPLASLALCLLLGAGAGAQQATYRGNPQRTGCNDNLPGPAAPNVLWVMKSKEHYIAAPVVAGNRLFVSGLGGFNVPVFSCLDVAARAEKRIVWSKTSPAVSQAMVSSPSIVGGKLIFGDGMHQNDGGSLHCLDMATGQRVWQLPMPGRLVHLEGTPAVTGDLAIIGGGSAGVLAVDLKKVTLRGKEIDPALAQKILAEEWAKLQEKFEQDKKKDPDFAVPPSADQLPMIQPKLAWQQGKDQWHVDAPIAIADGKVLVGSAYLDLEKEGDRGLHCLDVKTGARLWNARLPLNPWGGPTVSGDTIIVTGSNIAYDPAAINPKFNRGSIAAFGLDGKARWSKDITGAAVVSCAAIADGAAVCTATDGKVRAFELSGARRWIYDTRDRCFAPVAIAGDVVYAGDLKGVIHAIDLKTGAGKWTLDLSKAVGGPGMIYGGPVVANGRLYVATTNLGNPQAANGGDTAVVCIGTR